MSTRILIIEDDAASMELMLYLLKSFGYTPIFAFNAEDGLRLAKSVSPQIILCDIGLPGMSGATLLRALKEEPALRSVPIMAVTAMAMDGDEAGLMRLGFDGYMSKPIDPAQLQSRLSAFLAP